MKIKNISKELKKILILNFILIIGIHSGVNWGISAYWTLPLGFTIGWYGKEGLFYIFNYIRKER